MNKVNQMSNSILDDNIKELKKLFPEIIVDGKIDIEKFKTLIGEDCNENEEKYEFTWFGKNDSIENSKHPSTGTLLPVKDDSLNWNETKNIYIEGDNLEVLKILQKSYNRKVKMIYIDPPYNTGNDFVYNDSFSNTLANYKEQTNQINKANPNSNGRFHTDWLNMMYPRLRLARNLLSNDGVIFISIDDNEVGNLRKICDEIFGESNLVAQIPWQSRASIQNDTDFSVNHEYILVYARIRRQENRRLKESNFEQWNSDDDFVCKPLSLDESKFSNPDDDPRGNWKADPFDAPNVRPNLTYIITNPNTGEQYLPPNGRHWRMEESKYLNYLNDNRILFGKDGKGRPQLKVFYEEKKDFGSVDNSWFSADKIGTSTNGTKELMELFDGNVYFDTPKPTSMIEKLLTLANLKDDDIVMDFFSGSATTAHGLFKYEIKSKMKNKFIMIQLPEKYDNNSAAFKDGYKTICDIGEERIRRAGKKIKEENGSLAQNLDVGFKVFKLDSSNIKLWNGEKLDINNANEYFYEHMDPIVEGRTEEDLLYEILLKEGMMLSSPIEEKIVNGKKVYSVGLGYMIVCLDDNIDVELVREIGKLAPETVIFKDSGFKDENAKANALQELKKLGIDEEKVKSI